MSKLYYTPPSDECFNELKEKAIELWTTRYPEERSPGYAVEKVARIKDIQNVGGNFMYMVAMFDCQNHILLSRMLSKETSKAVRLRMIDGGQPAYLNPF